MAERSSKLFSTLMPLGGVVLVIIIGVVTYYAINNSDVGHALESDGAAIEVHE